MIRTGFHLLAVLSVSLLAGCTGYTGGSSRGSFNRAPARIKPVLAVMEFENKASFDGSWNLGQGMADLLVAELVETRQVEVLERRHLDEVVGEIVRQGQDLFRKEGRIERGRLKNAGYLVRGVVTDFTVTGETSGWLAMPMIGFRGFGRRARVAISVKVSDVTSGQVICAVKTDAEASAGGFGAAVNYRNVAFGGDAFLRTPIGKAAEKAIARAVDQILGELPARTWQPRVADVVGADVVVSGGRNAGVREGDRFRIRGAPRVITDPVTGNMIDEMPGPVQGRLTITRVLDEASYATMVDGTAKRGDSLEHEDER